MFLVRLFSASFLLSVFFLALNATPLAITAPAEARGIDWEGTLIDPPKLKRNTTRKSNLPGVGTTQRRSSDKSGCENNRIFNDAERAQCNRKTRLFVIRDGRLEGLFPEAPR